ncbi:hypothetical protein GOV07_03615, partial [Candidatus Woesearchaeota archaeon]|nr:hypothetical protein [Candidatus Woesearchaeota archaeon]
SDGDCSGSTPKCDVALGECFECLLDDDCASTEYCDEGSCEETTPSTITDMVITKNTVLFKVGGTYDCGAGPSPLSSPAINGFVYDEDTGAIYANDHAGMTRFLVNKLQAPTVTIKDLHGGSVSQCQINNAAQTVSNCIAINGDTAGCVPPRTYAPVMAGEGVVYVETTSSLSHENSHLLYSDTDGSFDLNVEFGTAKRITTPFIVARGNNNGDAIIAGMTGFKGNYLQFFDTGSKRYGLLAVGAGYTTSVTLTNLRLIDLTNTFNPVDLGPLSQHADLYKLIAPLCSASGSCYLSVLERTMRSATPEKHTILKEGSQYVLYDYTNPTAVTELDRFSCSSLFCYEGPVLGLRDTLGAVLEGDTIYVHIPGGADYSAIVKKDYPELNPLKVNKCHDRATKPCYFGQIWKHKLGTNGWQKAADIPGTLVQIRDGKAWLFGTGYGSHTGPDGIYDPNQLHSIPYSTNTYNANIFPGYRLKVYDLTDGSELLHEELKVPIDVFRPKMTNSPSLAVMEKGGKYYVYILYWAIANSPNHYNYLIGHEVSACSGASCNVGSIPLTTTTGAIVTVGGSGGSGGGGGTGAVCGNAIKETGEACDLGDASHGDGNGVCQKTCSAMCTLNSCGGGGACTCSGQGYECDWQSICGAVSPTMCGVCPTGEECNTAGKCEDAAPTTKTIQKKVESSPGNVITYGGVVCPIEKTCAMWTSGCLSTGVVPGYSNLLCTSDGVTRVCNPAMVTETRGIYTCAYPNGAYGWTTGGGGPGSS